MTRSRLWPVVLSLFLAASGAGCDPELSVLGDRCVVTVGQTVRLRLVDDDNGSDLDESTISLEDAAGRVYGTGQGAGKLAVRRVSGGEIELTVPAGIAQGEATLEVEVNDKVVFTATLRVHRMVVVRDVAGKIWILSLTERGLEQFSEIPSTQTGDRDGLVAIGPQGWLLATSSRLNRRVMVSSLGLKPGTPAELSGQASFLSNVVGLEVTSRDQTLVATEDGVYSVELDTDTGTAAPKLSAKNVHAAKAYAVAVDRTGKRAVVLERTSSVTSPTFAVSLLDLGSSPPTLIETIELPTLPVETDSAPSLAISPNGMNIIVGDKVASSLFLVQEKSSAAVSVPLPPGEEEPVAIAAAPDGKSFYVLNRKSSLSVLTVSGSTATFGSPISLTLQTGSGAPVDLALSQNGDFVVLFEHDLELVDLVTRKATLVALPYLFKDKKSGEVGNSIAIQP